MLYCLEYMFDRLKRGEWHGCAQCTRIERVDLCAQGTHPSLRYNFAASQDMIFHLLSSGGGYLSFEGDPTPLRVEDGAVLLFPFGHAHSICDELTSPLTQVLHVDYDAQREYQGFPGTSDGSKMVVLCGAFHVEHPGAFPLLPSLPKVIHIPAEQGRTVQGFAEIVHLIAREAATPRLGAEVMLRRLTELLFIEAVALSRSEFSARFTRLVGEPPITYLTHWRMHRATRLLKDNVEIEKIAELLGYERPCVKEGTS
jgi:AraC-like DNA-binding protein